MYRIPKKSQGFTLIEHVVVIVILGILAAVAIPRLIKITDEAYAASVNRVGGALRSAVALAKAQYTVDGNDTSTLITMDGTAVAVTALTGIPTGDGTSGIGAAMQSLDGFTVDDSVATAVTFRPDDRSTVATYQASYNGTTGVVTIVTTGC